MESPGLFAHKMESISNLGNAIIVDIYLSPLLNILCTLIFIGYCTNLDEYLRRLSKPATFRPHGELLHVYQRQDNTYEIYKVE